MLLKDKKASQRGNVIHSIHVVQHETLHQCFNVLPVHQRLFLDDLELDDDLRNVASFGVVAKSVIRLQADDEGDQLCAALPRQGLDLKEL